MICAITLKKFLARQIGTLSGRTSGNGVRRDAWTTADLLGTLPAILSVTKFLQTLLRLSSKIQQLLLHIEGLISTTSTDMRRKAIAFRH